jgi:hypothetical protein
LNFLLLINWSLKHEVVVVFLHQFQFVCTVWRSIGKYPDISEGTMVLGFADEHVSEVQESVSFVVASAQARLFKTNVEQLGFKWVGDCSTIIVSYWSEDAFSVEFVLPMLVKNFLARHAMFFIYTHHHTFFHFELIHRRSSAQ